MAEMKDFLSIVGTSIGSRDQYQAGEVWGLAWHWEKLPSHARLFEMHDPRTSKGHREIPKYWASLKTRDVTCLPGVAKKYGTKAYPLAEVRKMLGGRNYFTSSIAYMLALAIYEGYEEIGIYGVDLVTDGEYAYQRPCVEFLCGFAQGKGIKLTIPRQSALLRHSFVYGQERTKQYGEMNGEAGELIGYLDNQIDLLQKYALKHDFVAAMEAMENARFFPETIDIVKKYGQVKRLDGTTDAFQATKDAINESARGADMSRLGEIK